MLKNTPKQQSAERRPEITIIVGIVILALMPLSWLILQEMYAAMCNNSCDLAGKLGGYYGIIILQCLIGFTGVSTLIVGIVKFFKLKKK